METGTHGNAATASDIRVHRYGSNPKIGLPVPSTNTVLRYRHIEAMQAQDHLIIVRAPAGCGKTTLVGQWAAIRREAGDLVAWVTVDRLDNDLYAFWSLVIAAVDDAASAGVTPLSSLISPRDATEPGFLEAFSQAVARLGRPVSLVIDDFHEVHDTRDAPEPRVAGPKRAHAVSAGARFADSTGDCHRTARVGRRLRTRGSRSAPIRP